MTGLASGGGPALLAAQAVSMQARLGGLAAHTVDDMRVRAEELLERGDSLRGAIILFCTMYLEYGRDAGALRAMGEELGRAIDRYLRPEPVDLSRRDIHG